MIYGRLNTGRGKEFYLTDMKKIFSLIAAGAMALGLAACGTKSEPSAFSNDSTGNIAVIAATNASEGSEASSSITVAENTMVRVQSTLTSGKVRIVLQRDSSSMASVDFEYEPGTEVEYELEAGNYTVTASVTEKANGGIIVDASGTSAASSAQPSGSEEDGQNPVMNFVGNYAEGRCNIFVEAVNKTDAKFTVTWGSSAAEHEEWVMSGTMDADTLTVPYSNCVKTTIVFKEDGTQESATVRYENGTGKFVFTNDLKLTWQDDQEDAAKDLVFTYAN